MLREAQDGSGLEGHHNPLGPASLSQGRGGALESVRDGGGEKAPLPPWVWSQKSLSPPVYTGLGWPRSQPLPGMLGDEQPQGTAGFQWVILKY